MNVTLHCIIFTVLKLDQFHCAY